MYMTADEKKATKVVTLRSSWKMLEALSVELSLFLLDSHSNDCCIYHIPMYIDIHEMIILLY